MTTRVRIQNEKDAMRAMYCAARGIGNVLDANAIFGLYTQEELRQLGSALALIVAGQIRLVDATQKQKIPNVYVGPWEAGEGVEENAEGWWEKVSVHESWQGSRSKSSSQNADEAEAQAEEKEITAAIDYASELIPCDECEDAGYCRTPLLCKKVFDC